MFKKVIREFPSYKVNILEIYSDEDFIIKFLILNLGFLVES